MVAQLSQKEQIDPIIGYQAAQIMDPSKAEYANQLAAIYMRRWEPQRALESLNNHKHGEIDGSLRLKALIESGKVQEAAGNTPENEQEAILIAVATHMLNQEAGFHVKTKVFSEEGKDQLKKIEDGGVVYINQLVQMDLPQTALKEIEQVSAESTEKYRLKAELLLLKPGFTADDLANAETALKKGIALNPSNIVLQETLLRVYEKQKDQAKVDQQRARINQLKNGSF